MMNKTKHYYRAIGLAVTACLIIAAPFMLFTVKTPVQDAMKQETTLHDENEVILAYDRGYEAGINQGWIDAYSNMIEEAGKLDYNPEFVAPERKPK